MKKDSELKQVKIWVPMTSTDQIAALRLLIVYFTTFEENAGAEIMGIANAVYKHAEFADKSLIRTGEGREGGGVAHYHRANPDMKILSNNFEIMRQALMLWLEDRVLKNPLPDFVVSLQQRLLSTRRSSDFYFDQGFFRSSFVLDHHEPREVMRRVVDEHVGFWLVYRMSTAESGKGSAGAAPQPYVNVSLLRITPFDHLEDKSDVPKFIYEFRSDHTRGRSDRAEGYFYRTGGHINAIGRRISSDNRAVVTFSWRAPEIVLSEPVQHFREIRSLGYGTDSDGVRIGFLFIAKHIPGTENISPDHYPQVLSAYQGLIGRYEMSSLANTMNKFTRDDAVAGLKSVPPYISDDEYGNLLRQSVENAVLKQPK